MTHNMYYSVILGQWVGTANSVFDLEADVMKMSLHTDFYVPNLDAHDFWDDTNNEVVGGNYTAGGSTLSNVVVSIVSGTVTFDAGDVVFPRHAAGFSGARKIVIYRSTGVAATSHLFSVITLDASIDNITKDIVLRAS